MQLLRLQGRCIVGAHQLALHWTRGGSKSLSVSHPFLVAYARLYRGMHHLSDVVVGAIDGLICAGLGAHCL